MTKWRVAAIPWAFNQWPPFGIPACAWMAHDSSQRDEFHLVDGRLPCSDMAIRLTLAMAVVSFDRDDFKRSIRKQDNDDTQLPRRR
jgi:hypothetical protein